MGVTTTASRVEKGRSFTRFRGGVLFSLGLPRTGAPTREKSQVEELLAQTRVDGNCPL